MLPPRFPQRRLQRLMNFGTLSRGFGTCCLRFKNGVATTHAKLASGWLARLYREGVEPSGSLQKVSDHPSSFSGLGLAQGKFHGRACFQGCSSGRDVRFIARPPHRTVRVAAGPKSAELLPNGILKTQGLSARHADHSRRRHQRRPAGVPAVVGSAFAAGFMRLGCWVVRVRRVSVWYRGPRVEVGVVASLRVWWCRFGERAIFWGA